MISRGVVVLAIVLGIAMLANGTYMTIVPEAWYWMVPGVPNRGPFNQHFVRDIGIIYMLIGIGFVLGAFYLEHRFMLWLTATVWLLGHAIFHAWEVFAGICGPEALVVDFVGVTLPALLGMGLIFVAWKRVADE